MLQNISTIDTLLGNPSERYFAQGFKQFHFDIKSLDILDQEIRGVLFSRYDGPARPHGAEPHIGSIEYVALALRLATYSLNRIGRIGLLDVDSSFMTSYRTKLRVPLHLGELPFTCRLLCSGFDPQSLHGSSSTFGIDIGNNTIYLTVDHRGGARYRRIPPAQILSHHYELLYSVGYRYRRLTLEQICVDTAGQRIEGQVGYEPLFEDRMLHGIGSARQMLLPTEVMQVFGQLTQALLYKIKDTDRSHSPAIWLREVDLRCQRPEFSTPCRAQVRFGAMKQLSHLGRVWQVISLSGEVGSYTGRFTIFQKISSL